MKIYIAVDMEGVSGVNSPEHVKTDGRLYAEGRRLLTREINAAVAGAFDAGADEVIVADMHGGSNNLLTEDVDSRASARRRAARAAVPLSGRRGGRHGAAGLSRHGGHAAGEP